MSELDLVIRHGLVATAEGMAHYDIGVRDGRIVALGRDLPAARVEIDATGRIVTPGGIDSHCHIEQPMPAGVRLADDFDSASLSALCGGTTTLVPFAVQEAGVALPDTLADYRRRAESRSRIDVAFHMVLAEPHAQALAHEIPAVIEQGCTSFKVYMTYEGMRLTDRQILEVLALARREGAMTMVHAENADCIDWLTDQLLAAGRVAPHEHATARPMLVEQEAAFRAMALAELVDVPFLIVHVSSPETVAQIAAARARGLHVHAETCPQYLLLTAADLHGDAHEGAKYVCSPPPRDDRSREGLWAALATGQFDVVSSDHCPFGFADPLGKAAGLGRDFTCIPNGLPGVETRLPLLLSEGVLAGRLSWPQFVALGSTQAARLYGLYPRKGSLMVGADADIVVWNSDDERVVSNDGLHHRADYTPYEGMRVKGWPEWVVGRGEVLLSKGVVTAEPGRGRFVPCERPLPPRSGVAALDRER